MPLDFPSSPTNGQVYGNYYYNSARGAWNALLPAATPNFFTNATLNSSTLVDATATASVTSVTPLIVKSLSGQTTNIQSWQDSSTTLAGINQFGGFYTSNRLTVGASSISTSAIAHINTINAGNVGLLVKGSASQTANLQEWQNSSGTILSYVDSAGNINFSGSGSFVQSSTGRALFATNAAATTPLIVKAAASQTADLQQWQSSTGAVLSKISSAGELQVPRIGVGSVMPTTARLHSTADAATEVPIISRGAASQTANLQEWQNSSGTVLADVDNLGNFQTPKIGLGGLSPHSSYILDGSGRVRLRSDGSNSSGMWLTGTDGNELAFMGMIGNSSSNQVGFFHNGAWRLITDSSGRVNTPTQPSFFAYRSSGLWATQVWIADQTYFNIGGHYNTSNGRFTAPIGGRYFFAINSIGHTSGTTRLTPRINGNAQFGGFHLRTINTANYGDAHMTWIFSLAAGDYVDINLGEGYNYSDSTPYAFWYGFLLH